jgi:hypothetical protein
MQILQVVLIINNVFHFSNPLKNLFAFFIQPDTHSKYRNRVNQMFAYTRIFTLISLNLSVIFVLCHFDKGMSFNKLINKKIIEFPQSKFLFLYVISKNGESDLELMILLQVVTTCRLFKLLKFNLLKIFSQLKLWGIPREVR